MTDKKITGVLFKVENNDTRFHTSFRFEPELHNSLLDCISSGLALLEVNNGQIVKVEELKPDIDPRFMIIMTPDSVMKDIIKSKTVKKQWFYTKYMEAVKCCQRTAQDHLQRAIEKGIIEEVDYYTIKVKE